MVFIEEEEDEPLVDAVSGDKTQVGMGAEANDHIQYLTNVYKWFKLDQDCYRAAVAVALSRGKTIADLGTVTNKKNKLHVGGMDSDGRMRDLITTFRPDLADKPYYASEWLAEIGLSIIRTELDEGRFLSDILLGEEYEEKPS